MEDDEELDLGTPGASARRQHATRKASREQRERDKHPRTAGLRLAWKGEPGHEQVWARGAGGEERVAQLLTKHVAHGVAILHDRRIPGSRANIDHIAVAPSGVWVIDAKRYTGKAAISRQLFGQAKLMIKGRDQSKLIDGLDSQVALVRAALADVAPEAPVHGALCFVETELPMIGTLTLKGYPLLYPKPLAKRINAGGPLAADEAHAVLLALAAVFPVA